MKIRTTTWTQKWWQQLEPPVQKKRAQSGAKMCTRKSDRRCRACLPIHPSQGNEQKTGKQSDAPVTHLPCACACHYIKRWYVPLRSTALWETSLGSLRSASTVLAKRMCVGRRFAIRALPLYSLAGVILGKASAQSSTTRL